MKILVADDDPISLKVLEKTLLKWGHDVTLARDGAEAWSKLEQESFPLVVSDWMMPEVDGIELVKRIRRREGRSDGQSYTYIILLTAKSTKDELVEGMEAGADDYMVKPFDASELNSRVRAGERIIRLEQSLDQRNQELQSASDEIAQANEKMRMDLEAAARIQRGLLPANFPDTPVVKFSLFFEPCEELAGDILNVFRLDEAHVGLYVLDVSGHGVPSALLSVALHHLMSPVMEQSYLLKRPIEDNPGYVINPPVAVAGHLNHQYPIQDDIGLYFTLLYGLLDLETRVFRYVQAGHPAPVHVAANKPAGLVESEGGLPIGFLDNFQYVENAVKLDPGDRIYIYSDGIYEVMNAKAEMFGQERFAESLSQARDVELDESLTQAFQDIKRWNGDSRLEDDVTMLAFEILE